MRMGEVVGVGITRTAGAEVGVRVANGISVGINPEVGETCTRAVGVTVGVGLGVGAIIDVGSG